MQHKANYVASNVTTLTGFTTYTQVNGYVALCCNNIYVHKQWWYLMETVVILKGCWNT